MTLQAKERTLRIAVFFWEGYLGVTPSLINALRTLGDQGYEIDVLMQRNFSGFPDPPKLSKNIRLHWCYTVGSIIRRWLPESVESVEWLPLSNKESQCSASLLTGWTKKLKELTYWTCWAVDHFIFAAFSVLLLYAHNYACFIGVDRDGLIPAVIVGFFKRIPILCWSLELRFANESLNVFQRQTKRLEQMCLRRVVATITQDQCRAKALAEENALDLSKIIIVPNSPVGSPPIAKEKACLLSSIPQAKAEAALVLHLGEIGPEVMSLELARSTANWPLECLLVFHERRTRNRNSLYLRQVQDAAPQRVILSLDPVNYDDLDRVVSAGKIGVVLYREEFGLNFTLAGASGKLAQYLRCGLPVVCLDLPGIGDVVRKFDCGICVKSTGEMGEALRQILKNYDSFSMNALKCYTEKYEFSVHFEKVLRVISSLPIQQLQEQASAI